MRYSELLVTAKHSGASMAGLISQLGNSVAGFGRWLAGDERAIAASGKSNVPSLEPNAARGADKFALPHVLTFQALVNRSQYVYWKGRHDEALRHDREFGQAMRRDTVIDTLLNERYRAVSGRKWRIEVDSERDPQQKLVKDHMTKVIKSCFRFQELRFNLLEATWHGRQGEQLLYEWRNIDGRRSLVVKDHEPVNGDKIGYTLDHTPTIQVYTTTKEEIPGTEMVWSGDANTGGYSLLLKGTWRQRFIIHTYQRRDGGFSDYERADAIHGVGVRDVVYWSEWMKKDYLAGISDWTQRAGVGGIRLWYYPAGNDAAREEVMRAAKAQKDKVNIAVPVNAEMGNVPATEFQDVGTNGPNLLKEMVHYIDQATERYIVGQHMSGGQSGDGAGGGGDGGLGGTGRANFARDTKADISRHDAASLDETITNDLLIPSTYYTFPELPLMPIRFVTALDDDDPSKVIESATKLISVGVPFITRELRALTGLSDPQEGDETVGGQQPGMGPDGQPLPGMEGMEGGGGMLDDVMAGLHEGMGGKSPEEEGEPEPEPEPQAYTRDELQAIADEALGLVQYGTFEPDRGDQKNAGHFAKKGQGVHSSKPAAGASGKPAAASTGAGQAKGQESGAKPKTTAGKAIGHMLGGLLHGIMGAVLGKGKPKAEEVAKPAEKPKANWVQHAQTPAQETVAKALDAQGLHPADLLGPENKPKLIAFHAGILSGGSYVPLAAVPDALKNLASTSAGQLPQQSTVEKGTLGALATRPFRTSFGNKPNAMLGAGSRPQLERQEQEACQIYTDGVAYSPLNAALRSNGQPPEQYKQLHEQLQRAFAKAKTLDKPVQVQRGMDMDSAQAARFMSQLKAAQDGGKAIVLPGYTSTTTRREGIGDLEGCNVSMTIEAVHGLDLLPYAHDTEQQEFLINHGSKFTVHSVAQDDQGKWQIRLKQLPPQGGK